MKEGVKVLLGCGELNFVMIVGNRVSIVWLLLERINCMNVVALDMQNTMAGGAIAA